MQGKWARACLASWWILSGVTGVGPAQAQSAEQRLEAARQAIVEQALRQSTRVDAVSWVDTQGRLQEFHAYRQSAQVPAQATLPSMPGVPAADAVDLLRASAAPACPSSGATMGAPHAPLALQIQWPARMSAATRERLQTLLERVWLGNDSARHWRMYPAAAPWPVQASAYERLLLAPPSHQPQWKLLLQLETLPDSNPELTSLNLRLSLQRQQPAGVLFEERLSLPLAQRPQAWSAPEWQESAWQAVARQLQAWVPVLDQRLACEKVEPEIVATESGQWILNMGSLAGLRVGDEWALVNPAQLPDRSLQPGALDQMVIARVTQVQALRAHISLVVGDARAPRPGWVARPVAAAAAAATDVSWPSANTHTVARR